jgi:hypothetical protein
MLVIDEAGAVVAAAPEITMNGPIAGSERGDDA